MLSVAPLIVDDQQLFDMIIAAKQEPTRGHLMTARPNTLAAYQAYSAAAPDVQNLVAAALSPAECEALRHAYQSPTKPLEDLRVKLLERTAVVRCLLCGISESATLDHYLPKEDHPVFSVFSHNLVPACCPCDTRKRRLVLDEFTQIRFFIHPYFDSLPNEQFLRLAVNVAETTVDLVYEITQTPAMSHAQYLQLANHFRLLDLADRYRVMSLSEMSGKRKSFARQYGRSGDATRLKESLADEGDSLASEFGINHWRAVLYTGLAGSDEFCDGGFRAITSAT